MEIVFKIILGFEAQNFFKLNDIFSIFVLLYVIFMLQELLSN